MDAFNPLSGEHEPCTHTKTPHFEGDTVLVDGAPAWIDTVDLDGDPNYCRIRREGDPRTLVVLVGELRCHA